MKNNIKEAVSKDKDIENREMISDLSYYNEKVGFLISEWISDYGFNSKPDPYKAIAWINREDESLEIKQSGRWFWEYKRILELVEMMHDYNAIMGDLLDEARSNR